MKKNVLNNLLVISRPNFMNVSIFLLRSVIGVILFLVGSGKVAGWFGGIGMQTTVQFYNKMGFSVLLTYMSCYTEFIGGLLILIGLFMRPAAIAVFINMLVAVIVMMPKGFISGGADFPFTILIISAVLILTGPMAYSLDFVLFKKN